MEVTIHPLQRVLHVQPGANLLEVLREHQVPMSYSCMAGRCGTCRCKVLSGDVLDGGQAMQRPLDGEAAFVLACQTFLTEPCTIQIPEPDEIVVHPARIVKATVLSIEDMTHDIKRLRLKPAKPLVFSPGQYAQLQFTPEFVRPYSMAGLADDDTLEFHVRLVPDGRVTGYIANTLKVGDAVRVSGPLGSAYLRRKHDGPMLCVAGGTGLAPILSIIRGAVAGGMANPIHLYFGVRSPRDVYGLAWLEHLRGLHPALHLHVVVTGGADPRRHRAGLVTDAIEADLPQLDGWRAYLCGSPPMVEAATLLAKRKGIAPERMHADAFYTQGT
ncbi:2Fe-2S iron-sulfur cluster binding domain-containing protein [Aquincola sp. S2]|uniref:2Fe-2S iron-sulfur cluster binding domain-containing protein n=1 Tax=Pseudaquabacterium terrae TaxID=2732868 RepID=A0ABX2ECB8_9BURK|nr:2Fe-2S iron-sulfur cluster-binding protein [Aquabacterium terrae]NRF65417.1 2Fe-2S iron-sulfur cluster binding domain-containing protein [Aquabacterium terrae]